MSLTNKKSYNYELPAELIAQYPKDKRSDSRLLHLERKTGFVTHRNFSEFSSLLRADDVLVVNKTKVIPARLFGKKANGTSIEIFLLHQHSDTDWECLVKPGKRLKIGDVVHFSHTFYGKILSFSEDGGRMIQFQPKENFWSELDKWGKVPLPPYIKREATILDKTTYQTVYAEEKGSVAAPTAGLHFTTELLEQIQANGVEILEVILHVGLGTFRPVKTDNILQHKMHSEPCQISKETADKINKAKHENRRIIAVGTTTTRTLESFADKNFLKHGSQSTDLFLYPGKKFQIIDGLLTNFHMPESTLLMLVSAFAGYENTMNAYQEAVRQKYRFFSYGDAMLII
jgi:S-adenosylmethionine:tRNA ribosyltransferase-isomerase